MNVDAELFGVKLTSALPDGAVATAVVAVVEYTDPATSNRHLQLLSSEMPVWARLGMLRTVTAADEADAVQAFEPDND